MGDGWERGIAEAELDLVMSSCWDQTPREQAEDVVRAFLSVQESAWWCFKHNSPSTDAECDQNGMGERACGYGITEVWIVPKEPDK